MDRRELLTDGMAMDMGFSSTVGRCPRPGDRGAAIIRGGLRGQDGVWRPPGLSSTGGGIRFGAARPRRPSRASDLARHLAPRAAGSTCWHRARLAPAACAWVPRSTITPWSSTIISSAPTMVESRCAMTSVVRFARHPLQFVLDFVLGMAVKRRGRLVEHQDRRRLQMVRAMATRCFSPPESFRPRSPTSVS